MIPNLPGVLQKYFQAQNAHDVVAMAACFAQHASVRDEGRDITGRDAIRAWKSATNSKYRVTVEPLECRSGASKTIVVAKVSGTFPGSPANLTYTFGLSTDDQISSLEIN